MTLGFKQQFPWATKDSPAPTNFREKILANVYKNEPKPERWFPGAGRLIEIQSLAPKIHTMREDAHNRGKAGRKIEMVYRGAGYKIIDHFNKGIPELEKCVSVQKVDIKYGSNFFGFQAVIIAVDGRVLDEYERITLAKNDGFDSIEDFFCWFGKNWSGYILHWTDFRY